MTRLEHIGLAVENPEAVADLLEVLLGKRPYKRECVVREGVQTHFIAAGTAKLELLEALGPESPVARYLEKRGEGIHHLAFEVDDIDAHLDYVRSKGFTPLADAPKAGADGKRIFFLHPKETHGVLIEFCQGTEPEFSSTLIPFGEENLYAIVLGETTQPALLVLHHGGDNLPKEVASLLPLLEPYFHLLIPDLSRFGDLDPSAQVSRLCGILDAFDIAQTHLLGFDEAGVSALALASHHPDRIGRLAVHVPRFRSVLPDLMRIACPVLASTTSQNDHVTPAQLLAFTDPLPQTEVAILPGSSLSPSLFANLLLHHFLTSP